MSVLEFDNLFNNFQETNYENREKCNEILAPHEYQEY